MDKFNSTFSGNQEFGASFDDGSNLNATFGNIQFVHTDDYVDLNNKPKINGVTLVGDKSFEDLGDENLSNATIKSIFNRVFGGN